MSDQDICSSDDPRKPRLRHTARKLLKVLADKQRLLVTTHTFPDPDALASGLGLVELLRFAKPSSHIDISVKGPLSGGMNAAFMQMARPLMTAWDDGTLASYDAILLVDVQPQFAYSPLPATHPPTVVIDHHRARGKKPDILYCDIRPDVGACASIIYQYLRELSVPISATLGAMLLYAIESDLAGAATAPDELDNLAISNLHLIADARRLYQMRNSPLPREYYEAFHTGIGSAQVYGELVVARLGEAYSPETMAVLADFLLRYDQVQWALVSGIHEGKLVVSLRTSKLRASAGATMRSLMNNYGFGGGHRSKAGGYVALHSHTATELDRVRRTLRHRLLKLLEIDPALRPHKLLAPPQLILQ